MESSELTSRIILQLCRAIITTKHACLFSWVQTNYPTYYNKFREISDPAAAFVWQKLTVAGAFIAETTKPARDYLNAKIPQLLEKVRCSLRLLHLGTL